MKLFGGLKVQVMKKIRTNNNIATNQYDYKSINISYIYKCTYIYICIYDFIFGSRIGHRDTCRISTHIAKTCFMYSLTIQE